MGQRLVISVQDKEEEIAAIYYHWSAYTTSALYEAKKLLENLDSLGFSKSLPKEMKQILLIQAVEKSGGGIESFDEYERIKSVFEDMDFKKERSRNDGLIAITEEGMEDVHSWSEGDLMIDLSNETIYNEVYYAFDEDCVDEELSDRYGGDLEDVQVMDDLDISTIQFEDLDYVLDELNHCPHLFKRGTTYYELIE